MSKKPEYRFIMRNEHIKRRVVYTINGVQVDPENLYEVIIRPYKRNRSAAQNRLLHMWLGIIAKDTGYSVNDLRYELSKALLEPRTYTDKITGEIKRRVPSTTELKVDEFSRFLDDIDRFANQEMSIRLPRPDDMWLEAVGQGQ